MSMEEASIYWWKMMNLSLLLPTKKQRKTYLSRWGVRMCWTNNITCTIMYPIWIFLMIPHRILTKTKWIIYTWIYSIKQYVIFIIYIYIYIHMNIFIYITIPLTCIHLHTNFFSRQDLRSQRVQAWWLVMILCGETMGKPWENPLKMMG